MITLRNAEGKVKTVPTGLSWTAFFFGIFVFLFRGLPKTFFQWFGIFLGVFIIEMIILAVLHIDASTEKIIDRLLTLTMNGYMCMKLNQITIAALLKKGYEQVSEASNEIVV